MANCDVRVTGTVQLNFIDALNKNNARKAFQLLKPLPRRSWLFICVHEETAWQAKWGNRRVFGRRRECKDSQTSHDPVTDVVENAGFILLKDIKADLSYTNVLKGTASADILHHTPVEGIQCVQRIATLKRLTGKEATCPTDLQATEIIVAFNIFVKCADCME